MTKTLEPQDIVKIGDLFKQAREKSGITIKNISQQTKINISMLEKLENSQFENLPNKTYVLGYIKSCAPILKLDVKECVQVLENNYKYFNISQRPHPHPMNKEIARTQTSSKNNNTPLMFIVIGFSIFITILFFFIFDSSDKKTSTSTSIKTKTKKTKEPREIKKVVKNETKPILVTSLTSSTPLKKPIKINEKNTKETKIITKQPETKKIKLTPMRGALFKISSENSNLSLIPEFIQKKVNKNIQNVFIVAENGNSWITYKKNNNPAIKLLLKKGKYLYLQGKQVLLFIGNHPSIKIFLNNKNLIFSSPSNVKSFVFPHSLKKDYYYPLFIFNKNKKIITSKEYLESDEL